MSDTLFKNKSVVITGGSGGIGFELARFFLKEEARRPSEGLGDAKLVLIGSNSQKLQKAVSDLEKEFRLKPIALQKDLSVPNSGKEVMAELKSLNFQPDILVNNAGIGFFGHFDEVDTNKALQMIDLNIRSLVELTRLMVPGMKERRFGRILNVASTAAFQGIPSETVYAASKSFVLLFSEALSVELKPYGIGVTCLCPGPTKTDFFERGKIRMSAIMINSMMNSDEVARIGFEALKKRKPLAIAGAMNSLLVYSSRLISRNLATRIAGQIVKART